MEKILGNVKKLNDDSEFVSFITREEDEEKLQKTALALALEKGKELGLKEEKLTIAKAMLMQNINIQTIKECTGLSDNEINNLK